MQLVNESGQDVSYTITSSTSSDCGTIATDGLADLPGYDNQSNVVVNFTPAVGAPFVINIEATGTGEQIEMFVGER